jgi:hypothetical protein
MQSHGWISIFKSYKEADSLTRKMVVELLEKVHIHENGKISVDFRYSAEFERMQGVA